MSRKAATLTVALAVAPDVPHLLSILGRSAFGNGAVSTFTGYAYAAPGHEPVVLPSIEMLSHNRHCLTHSAIVLGLITLLLWVWRRQLWFPLLGWWFHVPIDVFTHSADDYPSPVLWPFTRQGSTELPGTPPGSLA